MILKKLFGKKNAVSTEPIYRIADIDASELSRFRNGIADINDHRIDGLLIRNFLTSNQTRSLIEGFERITQDELIEAEKGFVMYPTPFAKFNYLQKENVDEHNLQLLKAKEIWKKFPENFGFDFEKHLFDAFGKMSGGRSVRSVPGENGKGQYHLAGFKRLSPDQGKFTVHCGNYFHDEFSLFFNYLKDLVSITDQLSYFVTLQSSLEGGELLLYDIKWDQAVERLDDGKIIKTKQGKELHIDDDKQLKRMRIKPNNGDLFIFASADLWHKVTVPRKTERYTLGGFLGISHDNEIIYLWS